MWWHGGGFQGGEAGFDVGEFEIEEVLHKWKDQKIVLIVAPLGLTEELPVICELCRTPYEGDECPTCRAERHDAKRVIEERLRKDREEKDRLISDVEEWFNE